MESEVEENLDGSEGREIIAAVKKKKTIFTDVCVVRLFFVFYSYIVICVKDGDQYGCNNPIDFHSFR